MQIIKSSDVLQAKASTGLDKFWQGHICQDDKDYFLQSSSWRLLTDGSSSKPVFSVPYRVTIKNVGKANETSPLEQAELEFASMIKTHMDKKNYAPKGTKVKSDKLPLPMLAHKYAERKAKINWPCFVQPKLDGNRMIFDGAKGQSRGGLLMIPEVVAHLCFDTKGLVLDGELILPGNVKLQETMKAIKKYRAELSPTLLYCVYDVVDETLTYDQRYAKLHHLSASFPPNVVLVQTHSVRDENEMIQRHSEFLGDGYEGTIIRNSKGRYAVGQRSVDLQKYKDFIDSEFRVVGMKEGNGLYAGCGIFRCATKDGNEFDCVPEGSLEIKREYFQNRNSLIGKWLTIRYHGLSSLGIPVPNPVGIVVRDKGEF
jgi:DNA ligase 1